MLVHDAGWVSGQETTSTHRLASSDDTRYVLYSTNDPYPLPGPNQGVTQSPGAYLTDTSTKTVESLSAIIGQSTAAAEDGDISEDGRWIVVSGYMDLDPARPRGAGGYQAFLIDRDTGAVTLASRASATGNGIEGSVSDPTIDASGRYVFFTAGSSDLVPPQGGQPIPPSNIYRFDRVTQTTALVSGSTTGVQTGFTGSGYSVNAEGRSVAYSSVVGPSTVGSFLRDMTSPAPVEILSPNGQRVGAGGIAISGDGSVVAFTTGTPDIGFTISPGSSNVVAWERASQTMELISTVPAQTSTGGNGSSWGPSISENGTIIAFQADATNLVAGAADANGSTDVFLRSRTTDTTIRVSSVPGGGVSGNGQSWKPFVSRDGSAVAYTTEADNLTNGLANPPSVWQNVVTYDRITGASRYAVLNPGEPPLNVTSEAQALSENGDLVTFETVAPGVNLPDIRVSETVPGALDAPSRFVPLAPFRIMDSRTNSGVPHGFSSGELQPVQVSGIGAVPERGVSAIVLNVTTLGATGGGFTSILPERSAGLEATAQICTYPTGHFCWLASAPTTSNINIESSGQVIANHVTVPVGPGGGIVVYSSSGGHVIIDVAGYYTPSNSISTGRFIGQTPNRVLDTRSGIGSARVGAGGTASLTIAGQGGVPASGASAVVLNLTSVGAPSGGFVTAYPSGSAQPNASNLNTEAAGQIRANMVTVPIGADGKVRLFTSAGGDLLADVLGYYTSASAASSTSGRFVPITPQRFLDTRASGVVAPGGTITSTPVGRGVPAAAAAVVTNLTATASSNAGYLTAYPAGQPAPYASNLNITHPGQTIANQATVKLGTGGISVYSQGGGHVIADAFGWFTS